MNNYYFVIRKLHSGIYKKRTTKEIWGEKTRGLYIRIAVSLLLVLLMSGGIVFIKVLWFYIAAIIILFVTFLLSIRNFVKFIDKYEVDVSKKRFSFIKCEVEKFSILLKEYGFDNIEIKKMVIQIDSFNREKKEKAKRKYDVFWGFCSITFFGFAVSIGKSIWDSYNFKGNEALFKGEVVFGTMLIVSIVLILLCSTFYDFFTDKVSQEEKIKLALEDVLCMNGGAKLLYEES